MKRFRLTPRWQVVNALASALLIIPYAMLLEGHWFLMLAAISANVLIVYAATYALQENFKTAIKALLLPFALLTMTSGAWAQLLSNDALIRQMGWEDRNFNSVTGLDSIAAHLMTTAPSFVPACCDPFQYPGWPQTTAGASIGNAVGSSIGGPIGGQIGVMVGAGTAAALANPGFVGQVTDPMAWAPYQAAPFLSGGGFNDPPVMPAEPPMIYAPEFIPSPFTGGDA